MADLVVDRDGAFCSGCGERFTFIPYPFDSRFRGPAFSPGGDTCAQGIVDFASEHFICREPGEDMTESGLRVVDRRAR